MSEKDEIRSLLDEFKWVLAGHPGRASHKVQAAIEARVAALVAERDEAQAETGRARYSLCEAEDRIKELIRPQYSDTSLAMELAKARGLRDAYAKRIATLEARERAYLEAGKVLAEFTATCGELQDAHDIFTGQPGALEAWLAKDRPA